MPGKYVPELHRERNRLKTRRWREANRERSRELQRASYAKRSKNPLFKERVAKRQKERNAKAEVAAQNRRRGRAWLLHKYGLTLEAFDAMVTAQCGRCDLCGDEIGNPHLKPKDRFHVDHCHKTDKVRALLCGNCNRGLGMFKDSAELVEKAAAYLRRHEAP